MLAAGAGSRFGAGAKLLAPFRGRPLVHWALASVVAAGLDERAVVTGAVDLGTWVPEGVAVLHNRRWADGQATSLAVAVAWARERGLGALVVGLGDQPLVRTEAWRAVAAATATPIAAATYAGRRGHPVRLAREVWPWLPTTGDEGARSLFARPGLLTLVACGGSAADVDTVGDLEHLGDTDPAP